MSVEGCQRLVAGHWHVRESLIVEEGDDEESYSYCGVDNGISYVC